MSKANVQSVLASPLAAFAVTYLVFGLGMFGLVQVTETLLIPTIFFAVMLPALVSTAYHLKAPIMKIEHYIHDHWVHSHSH